LMLQFIPGTDFIFSGYSAVPRRDNMFGGGNFDADDLDDYAVLQRDMQIDGGTRSISEAEAAEIRRAGAQAIQAVYAELGFPTISDAEVEAAVVAHSSENMPVRDIVPDLAAADAFLAGDRSVMDVVAALARRGFVQTAENLLTMGRQRIAGDYLQPAAIFDRDFVVKSAINDPNDYNCRARGIVSVVRVGTKSPTFAKPSHRVTSLLTAWACLSKASTRTAQPNGWAYRSGGGDWTSLWADYHPDDWRHPPRRCAQGGADGDCRRGVDWANCAHLAFL
jgi:hypothetical protein